MTLAELLTQKRKEIAELEATTSRLQGAGTALAQAAAQIKGRYTTLAQRMPDADLDARWKEALKLAKDKVPDALRAIMSEQAGAIAGDLQVTAQAQSAEAIRTDGRRNGIEAFLAQLTGVGDEPAAAAAPAQAPASAEGGPGNAGGATGDGVQQ